MDIKKYSKKNPPSNDELMDIGKFLLESLSTHTGCKLSFFKIHITEEESFVGTFKGSVKFLDLINIDIEGVILFSMGIEGPRINSELLFFSENSRIGLRTQQGESYLILNFDENGKWNESLWMRDDIVEWLSIDKTRREQYADLKVTYDNWKTDPT